MSTIADPRHCEFPYFFVGTFIEVRPLHGWRRQDRSEFPYFFVGTFIEVSIICIRQLGSRHFPTSS